MKNRKSIIIMSCCVFLAIVVICMVFKNKSYAVDTSNSRTADTVYKDYGDLSILDNSYSNSVVYLTDDSEFKVLKQTDGVSRENGYLAGIPVPYKLILTRETDEVILLITKCAVDDKGNIMDVVIRVNNVDIWEDVNRNGKSATLAFYNGVGFLNDQRQGAVTTDTPLTVPPYKKGEPISIALNAEATNVDFTITYYKSGTVNESTGIGTPAGISHINSFYYDIDISNYRYLYDSDSYNVSGYRNVVNHFFSGNEGFVPINGSSTIYYNKNETLSGANYIKLGAVNNGLAIQVNSGPGGSRINYINTNGIWYQSTAFMTTETNDSSLKIRYGGISCGIRFLYMSPYPYTIPNPQKSIIDDKKEYKTGEEFIYKISQYIPNNYFGHSIGFYQKFSNIPQTTQHSSFVITDTINDYLSIKNVNQIVIVDENGKDVSNLFSISVNNKTISASAKAETLNTSTFYSHTYYIKIPVVVNKNVPVKTFTNRATSSIDDTDRLTNIVSTKVYYNLVVKYLEEGTNKELASSIREKKYHGDSYVTESSKNIPITYELVATPDNQNGTIDAADVEVIYYYRLIPRIAKLYKVDSDTEKHVVGAHLVVYDKDNKKVAEWETAENSTSCNIAIEHIDEYCKVYEDLKPNETYKVVEEKTPVGYATSEPFTFTTDAIGNYQEEIKIENVPIKICIIVVNASDKPIEGMGVEMRSSDGTLYKKFISNNDEVCYSYVPVAEYELEETDVVEPYEKADILKIDVKDTKNVQHFKIVNPIKVPLTSLDSSKIFKIVAIVVAILGFGILGYTVYRKKKN